MRYPARAALLAVILFGAVVIPFSMVAPKAFAKEQGPVRASVPPLHPVITLKFTPDFAPFLEFSIDTDGNVSFGLTKEWKIPTPLGVVTLSGQLSGSLLPQLTSLAQQTSMFGDDLLLIVRHKQHGLLQDSNYLIQAQQTIQAVDIRGLIDEVSVKWVGTHYQVFVDASDGSITTVDIQGNPTVTTSPVKVGCPSSLMIAWTMNLSLNTLTLASGTQCRFEWTNPDYSVFNWLAAQTSGNDSLQCPIGYGTASVQLSFPWWHPWDQGETQKCDGKTATLVNDMKIAESASITFNTNVATNSSPSIQTCQIVLPSGLNIRSEATDQSTLIAHYPIGTTLNYIKVVHGKNVNGNDLWGLSEQGHYFWLGGTDHPNG